MHAVTGLSDALFSRWRQGLKIDWLGYVIWTPLVLPAYAPYRAH
jgi:hypothetical protein